MTRKNAVRRLYEKLETTILPGERFAPARFEDSLRRHIDVHTEWLDLGCGRRLLPRWRSDAEEELVAVPRWLVGLDADLPSLRENRTIRDRVAGEISSLPFADASFDLVSANMVVEHLERPAIQFAEIARVLKPGGTFLFRTPNVYGYTTIGARLLPEPFKKRVVAFLERRHAKDVFPAYYRANSRAAIEALASEVGLEVAGIDYVSSAPEFWRFLPLAVIELSWIRLLARPRLEGLRNQLVVTLRRSALGRCGESPEARSG